MKLDLYSKINMVHAQATKLIMPNVSLHSLSHYLLHLLSPPPTSPSPSSQAKKQTHVRMMFCFRRKVSMAKTIQRELTWTKTSPAQTGCMCNLTLHVASSTGRASQWTSRNGRSLSRIPTSAKHRKIRMRWVPYQKRHVLYALSDILWTFQFRSLDLIVRIDRTPSRIHVHWCMHFWQCIENDQHTIRTRKERMTHEDHEEGFAGW